MAVARCLGTITIIAPTPATARGLLRAHLSGFRDIPQLPRPARSGRGQPEMVDQLEATAAETAGRVGMENCDDGYNALGLLEDVYHPGADGCVRPQLQRSTRADASSGLRRATARHQGDESGRITRIPASLPDDGLSSYGVAVPAFNPEISPQKILKSEISVLPLAKATSSRPTPTKSARRARISPEHR